jgi:exocyst complex component 7
VKYLKQIPDVEGAVSASLATLGDGNWKMGEGVGKGGKVGGPMDGNERVLLEHYICEFRFSSLCYYLALALSVDVIVTLISTLNTSSVMGRRAQMGSIYLLNNISHLRNRLLDAPESSIDEYLSKPTQDILNSNFRTAKAAYFDSNFSPLIQALADEKEQSRGLVGGGKSAMMKEKWSRFFDALEEVSERHRVARVLSDDPDGRSMLQEEVVRLVIPALLRFTQKNKEKEFSKRECLS